MRIKTLTFSIMVTGLALFSLPHSVGHTHADSTCELTRIMAGEQAYKECLKRHATESQNRSNTRQNKPSKQPVPPDPLRPSKNPDSRIQPGWTSSKSAKLPVMHDTGELSPAELFKRVAPSVFVVVAANSLDDVENGKMLQGSAVAVSEDTLYTNWHVVKGRRIVCLLQKGEIYEARIVSADKDSDRCVLKVLRLRLNPVEGLRNYQNIAVGERVFTVGAPHGLEHTLGEGLVSGKRQYRGVNLVQTTAPISQGSSGGGLFDNQGRLLGITCFLLQNSQQLNFAIAAEDFKDLQ